MVLQSIGQAAILSALNSPIRNFVLIGNLTQLPQCKEIFPKLEEMYGVRFLIPKYSEYRTAIGAALTYMDGAPIHRSNKAVKRLSVNCQLIAFTCHLPVDVKVFTLPCKNIYIGR